jgi:hypothetical protein
VRDHDHGHVVLLPELLEKVEDLAWIVTSSAVVGSSAIRSRGLHESAIAIMTRCLMPPEKRCG